RRAGRRLPRLEARARAPARRPFRADAHDAPGRSRAGRAPAGRARRPVPARRPARTPLSCAPVASLEGKTAIVTGASSGIGAATVAALRREGARVAGGARRSERIEADVALELDVTDPESCERFVERALEGRGGGVDV